MKEAGQGAIARKQISDRPNPDADHKAQSGERIEPQCRPDQNPWQSLGRQKLHDRGRINGFLCRPAQKKGSDQQATGQKRQMRDHRMAPFPPAGAMPGRARTLERYA